MAQFKYTIRRGETARGEVIIAAGTAEAQSDTISVNIDMTDLTQADAANMIEKVKEALLAEVFPPIA